MTKAKIDMELEPGVHVTVSAEAETRKEALDMAYSRAISIARYISAVEAEVEADAEIVVRGRRGN